MGFFNITFVINIYCHPSNSHAAQNLKITTGRIVPLDILIIKDTQHALGFIRLKILVDFKCRPGIFCSLVANLGARSRYGDPDLTNAF